MVQEGRCREQLREHATLQLQGVSRQLTLTLAASLHGNIEAQHRHYAEKVRSPSLVSSPSISAPPPRLPTRAYVRGGLPYKVLGCSPRSLGLWRLRVALRVGVLRLGVITPAYADTYTLGIPTNL